VLTSDVVGVWQTANSVMINTGKVLMKLTGHDKKVTDVSFHPDASIATLLTSSADKTAKLWREGAVVQVSDIICCCAFTAR
jgi:WD40 repeat protein